MTTEEKHLQKIRKNMLDQLILKNIPDPRQLENKLFLNANKSKMMYIEFCTSYLFSGTNYEEVSEVYTDKEHNISKLFESEKKVISDSRNALSRCGRCKSTNVENIARQVRSADEGMSVFSRCLDCGNKWVQR